MKPFAKRLLALASAAAITTSIIPIVHALEATKETQPQSLARLSSVAPDEQIPALAREVLTEAPLTRLGMSQLVMDSYRTLTGIADEELGEPEPMFLDTNDTDVLYACQLDLVPGSIDGLYEPTEHVTRQDFAIVCAELLETVGYPYIGEVELKLSDYPDGEQVRYYAQQPVRALLCTGILSPNAEGALEPTRDITVDEAMGMTARLVEFYTGWEENPVEPQRDLGEEVAEYALNYVGCRYVRGGQGPKKFDCSGFVYYVYKHFGYSLKPGARNQWSILSDRVSKSELMPGDLLFFSRNGRASGIFHVGIYIGDGQFVHAANSRKGVIVSDIDETWYANRYLGAKRAIQ